MLGNSIYLHFAYQNYLDGLLFLFFNSPFCSPTANYSLTQTCLQADKSLHLSFKTKASMSAAAMRNIFTTLAFVNLE